MILKRLCLGIVFLLCVCSPFALGQWAEHGYYNSPDHPSLVAYRQSLCTDGTRICVEFNRFISEEVNEVNPVLLVLSHMAATEIPEDECEAGVFSEECDVPADECSESGAEEPHSPFPVGFGTGRKYLNERDGSGAITLARHFEYHPRKNANTQDYRSLWTLSLSNKKLDLSLTYEKYPELKAHVDQLELTGSTIKAIYLPRYFINTKKGNSSRLSVLNNSGENSHADKTSRIVLSKIDALEGENFGMNGGGYRLTYPSGNVDYYDRTGRIVQTDYFSGGSDIFTYEVNAAGFDKQTKTNRHGHTASFEYTSEFNATFTDVSGEAYSYEFDAPTETNPRLTVTYPDSSFIEYEHVTAVDASGNAEVINGALAAIYRNGVLYLSYQYDPITGRAVHSEKNGGVDTHDIAYVVDANNRVTQATYTNALGKGTVYHFENIGGRQLVSQVEGIATSSCLASNSYQTFDSNGYRHTQTNERGYVTESIRNNRGLITQKLTALQWSGEVGNSVLLETADSQRITNVWDTEKDVLTQKRYEAKTVEGVWEAFKVIDYVYTAENRIEQRTISDPREAGKSRTVTYTYTYHDANNAIVATMLTDGPRTDVSDTSLQIFDTQGRLIESSNALGHKTLFTDFNLAGRATRIVDQNGRITLLSYDAMGRVLSTSLAHPSGDLSLNITTTYDYDTFGRIEKITAPTGSSISYHYDNAHRLEKISNHNGEEIHFVLDAAGNINERSIKSSAGLTVFQQSQVHDELNRLKQVLQNHGQTTTVNYDEAGNVASQEDGFQRHTQFELDGLNRIIKTIDPLLNETNIQYDSNHLISQVTDARNLQTTYTYNGLGELTRLDSPDTGIQEFVYDNAGNMVSRADARGIIAIYQYDALNRLTSVEYPNNTDENILYDYDSTSNGNYGIGQLTRLEDASGAVRYVYNYAGALKSQTYDIEGHAYAQSFDYNDIGLLTDYVYPSGRIIEYAYTTDGILNAISTKENAQASSQAVVSAISYLPFGPINGWTYGNGLVKNLQFDNDYRIESASLIGQNTIANATYGYDLNNNILSIQNIVDPNFSQLFGYDDVNRLDTASGIYGSQDYDYDAVGNRTQRVLTVGQNQSTENYTYATDSQRILNKTTSAGPTNYHYDENGNLLSTSGAEANRWTYNDANRPMTSGQQDEYRYLYNSYQLRTLKEYSGVVTHFHYNGAGQLIAESDSSGVFTKEYIWLNNQIIAVLANDDALTNAPQLNVVSPTTNQEILKDASLSLTATAQDVNGANISTNIQWTSNIDGVLGSGPSVSTSILSEGNHVISASVADAQGRSRTVSRSVVVVLESTGPVLTVSSPFSGQTHAIEGVVQFSATAIDLFEGDISALIDWSSSVQGVLGRGGSVSANLSLGTHTIDVRIQNSFGQERVVSQIIQVIPLGDSDSDGLADEWEVQHFGHLNVDPNGDDDNDGLTNLQELTIGTDPRDGLLDSDFDGLNDAWEFQYFESLANGAHDDTDLDGVTNLIEFENQTDPSINQVKNYLDPNNTASHLTLSEENRAVLSISHYWRTSAAIDVFYPGKKYYWEVEFVEGDYLLVGLGKNTLPIDSYTGSTVDSYGIHSQIQRLYNSGTYSDVNVLYDVGDRLMLAFDVDAGRLWIGVNGVWQGDPVSGSGALIENLQGRYYPLISAYDATARVSFASGDYTYPAPEGFGPVHREDFDGDTLVDAWEQTHFGNLQTSDASADLDGDAISLFWESWLNLSPSDGNTDADADQLNDAWEIQYFESLVQSGSDDADSDGLSNLAEFTSGDDPTVNQFINSLDSAKTGSRITLSNNNLRATSAHTSWNSTGSVAALLPGKKYYWEAEYVSGNYVLMGIGASGVPNNFSGSTTDSSGLYLNNGRIYRNAQLIGNSSTYVVGDRIMFAYDPETGSLWHGKNGAWVGDPVNGVGAIITGIENTMYPLFSVAQAVVDVAFEESDFQYAIPQGYATVRLNDFDNDGMMDSCEQQYFGSLDQSPENDFDNDGVSNAWECALKLDPTVAQTDSDNDGLPDTWEIESFRNLLQTSNDDFDNDGLTNLEEFNSGDNPSVNQFVSTLDTAKTGSRITLSNNNLRATNSHTSWNSTGSIAALLPGKKYYWEAEYVSGNYVLLGVGASAVPNNYTGSTANSYGLYLNSGNIKHNTITIGTSSTYAVGDRIMFAFDPSTGNLWHGKNGIWVGDPVNGTGAFITGIENTMYPLFSVAQAVVDVAFEESDFQHAMPQGYSIVRQNDFDTDGMMDSCEQQYFGNLDQLPEEDFDNDGLTNAQECAIGTDPSMAQSDSDLDGLPDVWEVQYFGHLNHTGTDDPDLDGSDNATEYTNGTNPTFDSLPNSLDPAKTGSGLVLSNDNSRAAHGGNFWRTSGANFSLTSGQKYYWEVQFVEGDYILTGIGNGTLPLNSYSGSTSTSYGLQSALAQIYNNSSYSNSSVVFNVGDRVMLAFDPDAGHLWFGVNGTWSGDPAAGTGAEVTGLTGDYYPLLSIYDATADIIFAEDQLLYAVPAGFVTSEVN